FCLGEEASPRCGSGRNRGGEGKPTKRSRIKVGPALRTGGRAQVWGLVGGPMGRSAPGQGRGVPGAGLLCRARASCKNSGADGARGDGRGGIRVFAVTLGRTGARQCCFLFSVPLSVQPAGVIGVVFWTTLGKSAQLK